MDELTELLNKGIEAKRSGNYITALEYYNKAQEINPTDLRIYGNKMKIHIGLKNYEQAFRNILILFHDNIANNYFSQDPMGMTMFKQFLPRFHSQVVTLSENVTFEPILIMDAASNNMGLVDLIYRADNLTFHTGHCYIGDTKQDDDFFKYIFNDEDFLTHFENFNNSLLGKQAGRDYRNSAAEGYFLCVGFIYTHMNLNLQINSKIDFIEYYLNPNTKIRKDIWNYRRFLS